MNDSSAAAGDADSDAMGQAEWLERVNRARAGDPEALNELLSELRPFVRGLAQNMLIREDLTGLAGSRFDASDVTQNTLMDVSLKISQFLGSSQPEFIAWVKKILHHDIVDCIRLHVSGQGRSVRQEVRGDGAAEGEQEVFHGLAADQSTASGRVVREESENRLVAAVESLVSPDRDIVKLSYFQQLSHAEIAERLGLDVRAVSKKIEKAKKKLKAILGRDLE